MYNNEMQTFCSTYSQIADLGLAISSNTKDIKRREQCRWSVRDSGNALQAGNAVRS